ncbi:hypothetical protein MKX03_037867 [Papaver bracteatum]|nr:hypothetical protein MKX03_037867 [Papaver bracteatum]
MVDAVISFVVEKLGDALIGETFFLHSVRSQVEKLRDELIRMQCFLKDADAREQQGDEGVRNWIAEIRNIAYDAEDVIDTFMLKVDSTCKTNKGIKHFLTRNAWMVKNLGHLYRVGYEILAIQARLKAISDSRVTYGIKDLGDRETSSCETNQRMVQHPLRNRYSHVEDNEVIGFEEHTKTLLTELMKYDERRCVISIVGVGGLGKTTLAKKVYRHDTIKNRFDCCGWSSISQQLNVQDSLGEILNKCMSLTGSELQMLKAMSATDLVEKLYNYLQDKRYFVVLDDVWKFDHWNTLSPAFPTGKRGSKVLLTTRNKDVALQVDPWSLHFQPQHLTDEESWELLWKAMNFLDIHNQQQHRTGAVTSTNASNTKLRRYAVHPKSEAVSRYEIHFNNSDSRLRTLLFLVPWADQKFRIENLINLQTFGCIKAGSWIRKGCLDKLPNLRKLSVCSTSRLQTDIILEEVVGKPNSLSSSSDDQCQSPIRNLSINSIEKLPNLIFDSLSCCHNLHTLMLGGRLDVINLHKYPQNLRKLHLSGSMLEEDPMATVQYLPNLKDLSLQREYEGEEMVCSSTGFPQLQILTFTEHKNLKEWRVDQGGMPHLKYLTIMKCRKLSMLPEGLRFITSLEQLNILGMPLVKDRIVKGVGEDWYKVQHVASITAQ